MAFRRSFGRGPTRRLKNTYGWTGASNDGFAAVAAGAFLVAPLLVVIDNTADITLRRIRGEASFAPNATVGDEEHWGAVGIIKVSDPAAAIPVVDLPWSQPNADWIWHQYYHFGYNADGSQIVFNYPIDSKAMRRIDDREQIVFVLENQSVTQVRVMYAARLLFSIAKR